MKQAYIDKRFSRAHLETIDRANSIITEYQGQGFVLTLRQLYYQFVARDLLANRQTEYKRLGGIINDARLAGHIDWLAINDGTRFLRGNSHWADPADLISSAADGYLIDRWERQDNYVEVWIEKDALVGVIEPACSLLDVNFFSCRGYTSQSEMWRASQRLLRQGGRGKSLHIIHLGDHDPSGMDMTRDIDDRLELFLGGVKVNRIALNRDQIDEYDPPPNPAKMTDSRFNTYAAEHGTSSWELDALEPQVIAALITEHVEALRDDDLWTEDTERQDEERQLLSQASAQWETLVEHIDRSME